MCAWFRAAFFYTRPILRHPSRDPLFVAFDRSFLGLLARPAQRGHHLGNMIDVVTNAVVPQGHFGDSRTGPQVGRIPVGLGAVQQTLLKKLPLIGRQLRFGAAVPLGCQSVVPLAGRPATSGSPFPSRRPTPAPLGPAIVPPWTIATARRLRRSSSPTLPCGLIQKEIGHRSSTSLSEPVSIVVAFREALRHCPQMLRLLRGPC